MSRSEIQPIWGIKTEKEKGIIRRNNYLILLVCFQLKKLNNKEHDQR